MADEEDPFEILKRKLEAKKKAKGKPRPSKPRPSRRPPPREEKKSSSWLDKAAGEKPAPVKRTSGSGKLKIIRSSWSKEDLKRMEESTETTKDGPPEGFESHRFDSELDPKMEGGTKTKKGSKEPIRRPKGFQSDRHDR